MPINKRKLPYLEYIIDITPNSTRAVIGLIVQMSSKTNSVLTDLVSSLSIAGNDVTSLSLVERITRKLRHLDER